MHKPKEKKDIECFKCKIKGHYARECKNKRREKAESGESESRESRDCAFVAEKRKEVRRSKGSDESSASLPAEIIKSVLNADQKEIWITDSGASRHMTSRREWFSDFKKLKNSEPIFLGDNEQCDVEGEGTILIQRYVNGAWQKASIDNVLYVPRIEKNLFSVGVCTTKGLEVVFKNNSVKIVDGDEVLATGIKQDNEIYRMLFRKDNTKKVNEASVATADLRVWHERLGHANCRTVRDLIKKGLVSGVKLSDKDEFFCDSCQIGKSHRLAFRKCRERESTVPGEVIHTDVCGPMSVESPGGARFLLTFKDDATSFRYIYFLKHKNDVYEKFKIFDKMIENKFGKPMRVLRSDNGLEYRNKNMDSYLESRGIVRECTAP